MEDFPQLYISEFGRSEDVEEEEDDGDGCEGDNDDDEDGNISGDERDAVRSENPRTHLNREPKRDLDYFLCKYCERQFTSRPGLERHMHTHTLASDETQTRKSHTGNMSFASNLSQQQHEKTKPPGSDGSVAKLHSSSPASVLSAGDLTAQQQKQVVSEEHHACEYCGKTFTTHTNKRRHERRVHENQLQPPHVEKMPNEENLHRVDSGSSQQHTQLGDSAASGAVLEDVGQHTEQYMLDVSSNISENLSFYIDGKIVSTSTVSNCEAVEVHSGSSTLVGLDALILDPTQISQVLSTDSTSGKEIPGQPLAKRRTATPPLLPQIKTELESEVIVSSSSSSLVSSLIENLLPQNTESTVAQKERKVFLSPKLKQLLEKQDGLKPTLALITDGQKPCSPISLSVLPSGTGRFKRRTGSPQQNTPNEDAPLTDTGDLDAESTSEMESYQTSPVNQTVSENSDPAVSVAEPAVKAVLTESWAPMPSGNSCNQQPLDLSSAVKRNEELASADAALDLSLQKSSPGEFEPSINSVSQKAESNTCMVDQALVKFRQQNLSLVSPQTPLVTDFTIVTGSDIVAPMEPVAEGLVYGLTIPPGSLTPSSTSLTPVALQPASPCAIAFASPASHTMLPTAPSLITVLAPPPPPPPPSSNPSSQPIQVLAPNISPESLVICADNAINSSECELTTAFAAASSANLVTLTQSLNPALNLPGHVFLTDQIALNPPIVESTPVPEVPFTPTVTLNDSLLNSYNIASNTVLIECTIALDAPGSVVPAAITLQENTAEPPTPAQMLVNHIEQQQIISVPNPQSVDPTIIVSSIAESVTLSTTSALMSDKPSVGESSCDSKLVVEAEPPAIKVDNSPVSVSETLSESPPPSENAEEEPSSPDTADVQEQTFTKNFICNVCDKLFHSMKELGQHVGDHADEWPYKCEFCVLLFGKPSALLDHRSSLHGVGKTYVCSACTKEFVYLCNLKQHQEELHPGQQCTYTEEEKGKLRPQNYNSSTKADTDPAVPEAPQEPQISVKKEEGEVDVAAEELFTTIKIMASDGSKIKGPDVRLGINQHYPSFKPPPFPYHNRSPAGSVASATNFTTHNIPQTFSTAIRCTKCGKSFDNMPELHKHILACANASDKRRYTPRKNPIPLRHFAKSQNGVLSTTNATNSINASNRVSQSNRSKPNQETSVKFKVLNKRKKKLVQRVMPQRNKSLAASNKVSRAHVDEQHETFICPHCKRQFTMRRSRTKHMAVCPKKLKEVKKRKDGGISVTKENDGHLHRGVSRAEEKRQSSPHHKTRLQTSGSAKRPAVLPVQTVFSNKRSKIIIKESTQPKQESATLSELPIVRTFNPAMRQYSRVQHGVKGVPIKFTVVKPQHAAQKEERPPSQSREEAAGTVTSSSEQSAAV